jgi:hypothetical protein
VQSEARPASPAPPKKSGARWVVTCLVIGCLGIVLIAGGIAGCVGCAAWKASEAMAEQMRIHAKLKEFHPQLIQHAEANEGAFPAEFDVGTPAEPGDKPFVYVSGLGIDMPGEFVLVYMRDSMLGAGMVHFVTISGSVDITTASEFDELLAAQKKAMEGMKQGGDAAKKAREEFEAFLKRKEEERRAREAARFDDDDFDWD